MHSSNRVLNYVMLCKGTFLRGIINDIILSIFLEVIIFITYDIILFFISEREVKFTQRCRLDLSFLRCGKGETNGLCEKEMIVVILFIEIAFQID